jgi:branched-chain amino acid transport system ATP-binding protein
VNDMHLEARDIHTWYGESYALQGTTMNAKRGSFVAILGRNGVGKSTLTRSITGLNSPRRGAVFLDGIDVTGERPDKLVARGVALVPQGRRVFKSLTVYENLAVAATTTQRNLVKNIDEMFDRYPGLAKRRASQAGNLSGGEQQMLAIARALMTEPTLLILDEPTEGLAPAIVLSLQQQLRELKQTGLTIVMTEQSLGFALEIADEVSVMSSRGKVVFNGTSDELKANDEVQERFLGVSI